MAQTASCVDICAPNNATLQDAFQFDDEDDVTWDLTGQHFQMDIKASRDDETALLTLTSDAGEIVVDDVTLRVIHLNVPYTALRAALRVNDYVYDLIMYDESSPPIRTRLMYGKFFLSQGVTEA